MCTALCDACRLHCSIGAREYATCSDTECKPPVRRYVTTDCANGVQQNSYDNDNDNDSDNKNINNNLNRLVMS